MAHPKVSAYIGFTQTKLSRRLQSHAQNGSIKEHFRVNHDTKVTSDILFNNTHIIAKASDRHRLTIKEALLISKHAPLINKQFSSFSNTLNLFTNNNSTEPSVPSFLHVKTSHQPNVVNTPTSSQAHDDDSSNSLLSPNDHTIQTHAISPNINNRINLLLRNSRNNTRTGTQPLPRSPHLLRSRMRARSTVTSDLI